MITELRVSNFKSLDRDVHVELGRFTALVGTNGSGKSSLVGVVDFVRDAMQMGLSGAITDRGGIASIRRWSSGRPFNVTISLRMALSNGSATYGFELTGDKQEEYRVKLEEAQVTTGEGTSSYRIEEGHWQGPSGLMPKVDDTSLALAAVGGDERFKPLFDFLKSVMVYSVYPDTLRVPQKYNPEKPMRRHGDNWVSVLKDQSPDTWKADVVAALNKLTGDIEDIKVTKAATYLVVQFRHGSNGRGKWFDAAQESDGTLRVAGIVTALLQEPAVPVIGIEEPELTVHPGALPLLVDFLHQASKSSQVIITTHSPELLDLVDADDVRVVERVDGITRVGVMRQSQRDAVRRGLMRLGELMTTAGLQGELFPGNASE